MVYVQSSDGVALMPTLRYGKVRRLLRDKKAVVVKMMPFTVRLTYDTTAYTQEVSLGVDAGSKYIGISATTESKELFSAQIEVRTDIVKLIADRREHRASRRSRKTRYRPARFNNRRKRKGWIAPSIRQKVEAHLKAIRMVHFILPVKRITIEVAQFDEQLIKNPCISGEQYQQGEQLGFWNVREYVLCRDDHVCQNCKGKSKDKILNVHHLESRKTGGNAPNNLITLCKAWRNHPCVLMYKEHTKWVENYLHCLESARYQYMAASIYSLNADKLRPPFHTEEYFNHMKSRLYTKDNDYYRQWESLGESDVNHYFVDGEWRYYRKGKRIAAPSEE